MYGILLIVAILIIIILIIGIHEKSTNAICTSRRRLEGKTALVTGGTAGMGLEIAKDLAHRGARVIVACPFIEEGTNARKEIVKETENENVVFKHLDLSSVDSIRTFAADVLTNENRLDMLINNAGVGHVQDSQTKDHMHFIMQVNYYGSFLLTLLLLPLLLKTGKPDEPSRILLTSSVLHNLGQIDVENINRTNYWYRLQIYCNSKLCLVLFGNELAKRLKGTSVVVNTIDPGAVGTRIFDSGSRVLGFFLKLFINAFFKNTWQGAQTALHVMLDKKAGEVNGGFFKNCKVSKPVNRANCDKTAKVLWEESMRLVNLSPDELEKCFKPL
ncbi:unnamed protein product [Arctia plantaginis]|uniref:Retinol dehydrogenase 11 n=1 Tax=Arctia plantaginis TaxID=874455 RepID=A0A8S1BDE7_ARCPL|nr:unnamed protein product [Arctia plantaginis]